MRSSAYALALYAMAVMLGACGREAVAARPGASAPPPSTPILQGPQREALTRLEQRIASGEFPNVHGVLIERAGATLAEWYFTGPDEQRGASAGLVKFGPDVLHDVRSITKSVVSLLVGIAQGEGAFPSLDQPVIEAFPEYGNLSNEALSAIRVRHLLTMTAGLRWDEDTFPYSDLRNSETAMDASADPVKYVLEQPAVSKPGAAFRYSGGNVVLIAELLQRRTGVPLDVYAQQKLFTPLGITRVEWHRDRRGVPLPASGLRLLPSDMLKLGELMLHKGRWQNQQVVAESWVTAATTPHAQVSGDAACGVQYGFLWWLGTQCDGDRKSPWVGAFGNGAQRIVLMPELDTVVVLTAGLYDNPEQGIVSGSLLREAALALAEAH